MKTINLYDAIMQNPSFAKALGFGFKGSADYTDTNHPNHDLMVLAFKERYVEIDEDTQTGIFFNYAKNIDAIKREIHFKYFESKKSGHYRVSLIGEDVENYALTLTSNSVKNNADKPPSFFHRNFNSVTKKSCALVLAQLIRCESGWSKISASTTTENNINHLEDASHLPPPEPQQHLNLSSGNSYPKTRLVLFRQITKHLICNTPGINEAIDNIVSKVHKTIES